MALPGTTAGVGTTGAGMAAGAGEAFMATISTTETDVAITRITITRLTIAEEGIIIETA